MLPRSWRIVIMALDLAITTADQKRPLEDREYWWNLGQQELVEALETHQNWNVAKNIILFLGDGMGITTNTAARIYKGQKMNMSGEEGYLTWERFSNAALIKTYNVDMQVPESAAGATAFLCGVKTNSLTLGVDANVKGGDCQAAKNPRYQTPSILKWAQEAGKETGFVTTTTVTHGTPAALYAHSASRRWECDSRLGEAGKGCKDIADQLVTEDPGKNIKVIFGGGRQVFGAPIGDPKWYTCTRNDGRDLTKEWMKQKADQGKRAAYVTTSAEMNELDVDKTDFVLGLFNNSHMNYEVDRESGPSGEPSIKEMTVKALQFLQKGENGFFLMVEGGRIDHGLHDNMAQIAFEDVLAMDEAVEAALKLVDLEETLIIVTADHSHVMTFNGYPKRGNSIIGLSGDYSQIDNLPYTTLMFTNGPGYNYSVVDGKVTRAAPSKEEILDANYRYLAAVPKTMLNETHAGEDVGLWAVGPMAHSFHRTHEQNYIAHVMAYAACVGPNKGSNC